MCLIAWLKENENDKEVTVLIFHPNLRLCTKTLVLALLCNIDFRGPPQGSQNGPAFAKVGTVNRETCRLDWGNVIGFL